MKPKYTTGRGPRDRPAKFPWWQKHSFLRRTLSWRIKQVCFKEIHFALQIWSQLPHLKQATPFQERVSRLATMEAYGTIFILLFMHVRVLAGSWPWILHSGGHEDPTTFALFHYEEIRAYIGLERERDSTCGLGYGSLFIFSFHWRGFCFILSVAPYKSYHKFEIWSLLLLAFEPNVKMLLLLYLWSRQSILNVLEIVILVDSDLLHAEQSGFRSTDKPNVVNIH